jgi:hypothetical protein
MRGEPEIVTRPGEHVILLLDRDGRGAGAKGFTSRREAVDGIRGADRQKYRGAVLLPEGATLYLFVEPDPPAK